MHPKILLEKNLSCGLSPEVPGIRLMEVNIEECKDLVMLHKAYPALETLSDTLYILLGVT